MDWIVAFLIIAPAVWLLWRRSTWLLDYSLIVYAFNRFVRRVVDWQAGAFNPFSPISLTPLIVSGLLFFPFLVNWKRIHPGVQRILLCFYVAISYGILVGVVQNGFGAIYAGADFLVPVFLIGYAASQSITAKIADRWMTNAAWIAVVVAAYGWYQYLTIPPWDAFWVKSVGFVGYLGQLVPTQMTVFSTLAERGPCASLLALTALPMAVVARWRTKLGWPAVILVLSAVLLTLVRSSLILVVIGVFLFPVINGGRGAARVFVLAIFVAISVMLLGPMVPGVDRIAERFQTIQNIREDGSFKGRLEILEYGVGLVAGNPIGYGIGSSGLAARITSGGDTKAHGLIGDNGYLELMTSLGWPGSIVLLAAFVMLWGRIASHLKLGARSDLLSLGRTYLVVFAIAMYAGNFFAGVWIMWVALGLAINPSGWTPRKKPPVVQAEAPVVTP